MKRRDFVLNASGATVAVSALSAATTVAQATGDATNSAKSAASSTGNRNSVATPATRPVGNVLDPSYIESHLDCRSISFENPTGGRGNGGRTHQGRKGRPFYILDSGEKVILADIQGPGTIRHIWTMLCGMPPEISRALRLEVFYDGLGEPSISVPILDYFGLPHGRCAEYYSVLSAVSEGRGMNSYIPMPFGRSVRVEFTNESRLPVGLFYQIDYTLDPTAGHSPSYLHGSFRRENPTQIRQDFVIAEGLKGPGRFLGCSVGIRVSDKQNWYGEGEVKIYRDGDEQYPTYCGTGLEDYVGSAYGLGRHYGLYAGSPLNVPITNINGVKTYPDFVSFYRWHVPDPVMFVEDLRVTIQQIGGAADFKKGQEAEFETYKKDHQAAGPGWLPGISGDSISFGLIERQDDYCATAFVYCRRPQVVPRYSLESAIKDIAFTPEEAKSAPQISEQEWREESEKLKAYWGR
jgi:hypothetical protein